MTKIVENLSINPLAKIDDTDFDEEQGKYETDFVEVALRKFVRLLQVMMVMQRRSGKLIHMHYSCFIL